MHPELEKAMRTAQLARFDTKGNGLAELSPIKTRLIVVPAAKKRPKPEKKPENPGLDAAWQARLDKLVSLHNKATEIDMQMSEMRGRLDEITAEIQQMKSEIDDGLQQQSWWSDNSRHPSLKKISHAVADYFGVPAGYFLRQVQTQPEVKIRQIIMHLADRLTILGPARTAKFLKMDRTTVVHGMKVMRGRVKADPRIQHDVKELIKILSPGFVDSVMEQT